MSHNDIPFGSPDPFLACEGDVDVDAEHSRSHHSFLAIGDSNSTAPADAATATSEKRQPRGEADGGAEAVTLVSTDTTARGSGPDATHESREAQPSPYPLVPLPSQVLPARDRDGKHTEREVVDHGSSTAALRAHTSQDTWTLLTDAYAEAIAAAASRTAGKDGETGAEEATTTRTVVADSVLPTVHNEGGHTPAHTAAIATRQDARRRAEQELSCTSQHAFAFLLTDAFHAVLWYVLHHAGPALSVPALVTARAILDLAPLPFASTPATNTTVVAANAAVNEATPRHHGDQTRLEAAELLIRLALRKPSSFTLAHLEAQYGDQLHVQQALDILSQTPWKGETGGGESDEESAVAMTAQATTATAATAACASSHTLLRHNDGQRVGSLLAQLHPIALRYRAADMVAVTDDASPPLTPLCQVDDTEAGRELLELLYAVRVRELRTLAFALYYHYHPSSSHADGALPLLLPRPSSCATAKAAVGRSVGDSARKKDADKVDEDHDEDEEVGLDGATASATPRHHKHHLASAAAATSTTTTTTTTIMTISSGAPSTLIPSRKREILQYLIEQRFRDQPRARRSSVSEAAAPGEASAPTLDPTEDTVEAVMAAYWALYIGSLYTVPVHFKRHVHGLATIFHALTGNFGAGGALATLATSGTAAAAAAAAAPSLAVALPSALLLVRPQLLLMVSHARHRLARAMLIRRLAASASLSPSLPLPTSWLPPWWWAPEETSPHDTLDDSPTTLSVPTRKGWTVIVDSSAESTRHGPPVPPCAASSLWLDGRLAIGQRRPHLILFPTPKALKDYQDALHAHQGLFVLTEAPASALPKQQLRDTAVVRLWYAQAMNAIDALKQEARRAEPQLPTTHHHHHPHHASTAEPSDWTIPEVMRQYGLFAQHLLQFLPLYRWFSYLELLVPVLQSRHLYTEANVCLRILTEEPLFTLTPALPAASTADALAGTETRSSSTASSRGPRSTAISAAARAASAAAAALAVYHFYYRPEKHGEWRQRLALNMTHLQQHEAAMQVLETAHRKWHTLWAATTNAVPAGPPVSRAPSRTSTVPTRPAPSARSRPDEKGRSGAMSESVKDVAVPSEASLCALLTYAARLADRLSAHQVAPSAAKPAPEEGGRTDIVGSGSRRLQAFRGLDDAALVAQLPQEVQRRCRLLRSTFPRSHDMAAYHAVLEWLLPCYCRRADRLMQEKSLKRLHMRLRRWTPLPLAYTAFSDAVAEVPTMFLRGCRDAQDPQLWHAPSADMVSARLATRKTKGGAPSRHKLPRHERQVGVKAREEAEEEEEGKEGDGDESREKVGHAAAHNGSSAAPAGVEEYVLRRCLETWNRPPSPRPSFTSSARKRARSSTSSLATTSGANTEKADAGPPEWGPWRGAHCEGAWIALAARALLWDCYFAPFPAPSTPAHTQDEVAKGDADPHYVWLSPFQEAPLDVLSSVQFSLSRRRLIEEKLAYLAQCSKPMLLAYVAARVRHDGSRDLSRAPPRARSSAATARAEGEADQASEHDKDEAAAAFETAEKASDTEEEESVLLSDHEDEDLMSGANSSRDDERDERDDRGDIHHSALRLSLLEEASNVSSIVDCLSPPPLPATTTARATDEEAEAQRGASTNTPPVDARTTVERATNALERGEILEHFRVDLGGFPLLDLLHAVPQQPLLRLIRHLYLDPLSEGYGIKFSGFPDLVFWRTRGEPPLNAEGEEEQAPSFAVKATHGQDEPPLVETFRLIEVKSPSDVLSTKQININDCLQRCGFRVEVGKVVEVRDGGRAKASTAGGTSANRKCA